MNALTVNPDLQPKLAEWFASQSNMTWLQSMLDTHEGKLLVDVLREGAQATDTTIQGPGDASYLERIALAHAKCAGVRACVETLVSLRHPVELPQDLPREWEGEEDLP
jgi:hypothetical protein